jgi:hypothetical protein
VLAILVAIAVVCFVATLYDDVVEPGGTLGDVLGALNTHDEGNLVTWLSSVVLAAGGVLCIRAGQATRRAGADGWLGWMLLGVLLVAFAIDEVAQIHERSAGPVVDFAEDITGQSGGVARVVAAALAAAAGIAVLVVAIPWLRRLAPHTRNLLLVAGALYFGGAFGLEIVARLLEKADVLGFVLDVLPSIEELAEMIGSALLVYAVWPLSAAPR